MRSLSVPSLNLSSIKSVSNRPVLPALPVSVKSARHVRHVDPEFDNHELIVDRINQELEEIALIKRENALLLVKAKEMETYFDQESRNEIETLKKYDNDPSNAKAAQKRYEMTQILVSTQKELEKLTSKHAEMKSEFSQSSLHKIKTEIVMHNQMIELARKEVGNIKDRRARIAKFYTSPEFISRSETYKKNSNEIENLEAQIASINQENSKLREIIELEQSQEISPDDLLAQIDSLKKKLYGLVLQRESRERELQLHQLNKSKRMAVVTDISSPPMHSRSPRTKKMTLVGFVSILDEDSLFKVTKSEALAETSN